MMRAVSEAAPPPPHRSARTYGLSIGQVAEWLVWTHLVGTSGGDLHVFLPLRDEGVDGIVHRLSTDEYARVQVKGRRPQPSQGYLTFVVADHELTDDRAVVLGVEVDRASVGLGPLALLVDVPTFRERATREVDHGYGLHSATVKLPPAPGAKWAPWCVPLEEVGDRLLPPGLSSAGSLSAPDGVDAAAGAEVATPLWTPAPRMGYRAEMELVRRAADCDRLNTFKAFPDLEPNEYLMYDLTSRGIVGIQVKAVTFGAWRQAVVNVYRPALRPSPTTWFVVFASAGGAARFEDVCAVVPSQVVAEHLVGHGPYGVLSMTRRFGGFMAPWRVPVAQLGERLAEVAASLA